MIFPAPIKNFYDNLGINLKNVVLKRDVTCHESGLNTVDNCKIWSEEIIKELEDDLTSFSWSAFCIGFFSAMAILTILIVLWILFIYTSNKRKLDTLSHIYKSKKCGSRDIERGITPPPAEE